MLTDLDNFETRDDHDNKRDATIPLASRLCRTLSTCACCVTANLVHEQVSRHATEARGPMSKHEFLVLSTPREGDDIEFNRWYSDVHIPDVLAVPGVVSAQRFRIMETRAADPALPRWRYVAIYTIDSEDPDDVLREIRSRSGTPAMVASETLDRTQTASFLLAPIESSDSAMTGASAQP